jgi:hypothetical protein
VHASLFKSSRVFAVSNEAANRFETHIKAVVELAEKCGLGRNDLIRIMEAKRKLSAFRPLNYDEKGRRVSCANFSPASAPRSNAAVQGGSKRRIAFKCILTQTG